MRELFRITLPLLLTLAAAVAQAQTWTASEPTAGTFYLYNVGTRGFFVGGNNYTTRASTTTQGGIPVTLEAASTAMQFKIATSPTYDGKYFGNDMYVDKASNNEFVTDPWEFVAIEGLENTYALKETRKSRYLLINTSTNKSEWGTTDLPTTENGYWKLVTKEALIANLANASEDNPIDATFAVMNAYFGANCKISLWTGDYTAYNGVNDNKCIEQWNRTFDMYQTITGLPNGVYTMQCQGYYRMGGGNNDAAAAATARSNDTEALNAKYYINEAEGSLKSIFDYSLGSSYNTTYNSSTAFSVSGTNIYVPNSLNRASSCFLAGEYVNEPIKAVVTDGTVKLGFRKTVASSNDWAAFDNVTLTYYGIDLSALVESYNTQLTAAKELQSAAMQATVKDALDAAVTAAETDVNTGSQAWLETTLSTLSAAITAAQASRDLYANTILPAVEGMKAQSTSESVKEAVQAKYDAGEYTSAADVYAYYQPLEIAALGVTVPEGSSEGLDYTSALINPGFELGNTDGWAINKTGNDTGAHTTANGTYAYSGTEGTYLFNTWASSVQTLDVGQTVKGLPTGYYTLSAVVASFGDGAAITMTANGKSTSVFPTGSDVDAEKAVGYTLSLSDVLVSKDGTLTFTVQNTGKGQTLLKADVFHLTLNKLYTPLDNYTDLAFTLNVENDEVAKYLTGTTYTTAGDGSAIANYATDASLRNDQPAAVTLPIPAQDTDATLYLSLTNDYASPLTYTVPTGTLEYAVSNLLPNQTYHYKLCVGDGTAVAPSTAVVTNGTITTTGTLRMIKAEGIANMRDLGGWQTTDGGTVRYGRIYRGSELRGGKTYTATDDDLAMLKDELGIGAEVDLREDVDLTATMTASAVSGATYYYANLSRWSEDALNFDAAKFKAGFGLVLEALRADKAAYFHCIFGADRTGCFAFLLEGLMGLPVDQLYKDYELTSFSSAGTRAKTGIDHKLQYISALPGETLQEKFYNYWRGAVGVSTDDLNAFITLMVDGPNTITTATLADLPTKAVADGEYYLYLPAREQFVSRGRNYGTQGVPDDYGIPATVRTNGVGVTTVQFLDNSLYLGSDGFTDKAIYYNTVSWVVESQAESYILRSHNGNYLTVQDDASGVRLNTTATTADAAVAVAFLTQAEQKALLAEAAAANLALAEGYSPVSTNVTITAATAGSTTAWVLSEPNARGETANYGNAYNVGDYGGELYQKNASVSQTVTVPHAGLYRLTLNALYRQGSNVDCYAIGQKGYELSNAYVSVNDDFRAQIPSWYSDAAGSANPDNTAQAKALMDAGKYAITLYAYIGEECKATIAVNVPSFTSRHWCLFNNFVLTPMAKDGVVIDEAATEAPAAEDFANVTLTRTLQPAIWNTFSVPFNLTYAQLLRSALKGATIYGFDSSDATTLNLKKVTTIQAGKPYLVQLPEGAEAVTDPQFSGVTVVATEGETLGDEGNVQFVGQTYARSLSDIENVCYLATNGFVKQLAEGGTIKGLRAYFIVPDPATDVKLYFGDSATGILEVNSERVKSEKSAGAVYDLSGRKISNPSSLISNLHQGVYIANGKKVIIR